MYEKKNQLISLYTFFKIIYRYMRHTIDFGPKDFSIILLSVLQLLLIGFTIYQYLPSAPKGDKKIRE
jgi:hypothetical protein